MYALYKLAQVVLEPGFWIALGMIAGLALAAKRPRTSRGFLLGALALFVLCATRPVSDLLARPLERAHPSIDPATLAKQEAIVVLSGGAHFDPGSSSATVFDTPSLDRTVEGVILWRAGVAPSIIISGGVGDALRSTPPEAPAMRDLALALGVPAEAVAVEGTSRTTAENAAEVRRANPSLKKIALVSTGSHLARSIRLFEKQGFQVTAVPAGHITSGDGWTFDSFVPGGQSLRRSESAIHEYAGLLLMH